MTIKHLTISIEFILNDVSTNRYQQDI